MEKCQAFQKGRNRVAKQCRGKKPKRQQLDSQERYSFPLLASPCIRPWVTGAGASQSPHKSFHPSIQVGVLEPVPAGRETGYI